MRERKQLGHWECDLIQFRKKIGKAAVTLLVERVSRFTVFLRNNDRQSKPIMDGLINTPSALPHAAVSGEAIPRSALARCGSFSA